MPTEPTGGGVAPWQVVELSFESAHEHSDPYSDVDASVTLTGPTGARIRRPAFWDGGRTWRARFVPPTPGTWRYQVSSQDRSDAGLNRPAGEIVCHGAADGGHEAARTGFLRASADRHNLERADGTPFFWLGDTHWRFAWERWDESNKPGWSSQFRGMVDRRTDQGFTVYQTNIMSFGGPSSSPSCWLPGRELAQLDIDYLRDVLDPRMEYIAAAGLVNAIGLAWYQAIDDDVAGMARFARYLVARYGAYPLVWTLGGEVAGYDPELRQRRLDGWRQVALAIKDADNYRHPITAHLTAERPIPSYYQDEDWLDLTLNQHGHGDVDPAASHYRDFLASYARRPLIEGETMYEGLTSVEPTARRTVTDTMVRQAAWRAIQSGCCGYTYGAQGCWNNAWDRSDMTTAWGDLPWYDGIDLPGATQMGHMRRFYEAIDWTALRPDPECFVTENVFNTSLYSPALSADCGRRTIVAYFGETYRAGGGQAWFTRLQPGPYALRWYDPRAGAFQDAGDDHPTDGRIPLPEKPDARDWVLLAIQRHPT